MNTEEVQRRLWEQSRTHKAHREAGTPLFPTNPYALRIRNLMDLMHHPAWLRAAAERVMRRSHNKAPGVDGVTPQVFRKGYEEKIEALRLELKRGTYQPQPVRRVMIPKANGKMRALGIPCLRDKIVQEAIRMALEPIFEVEFHDSSYGFRPHRNTHHAISRCQLLMGRRFSWVIEGDVKACFDEISHKAILKVLREKVQDNKFLDLIYRLLKAGVEVEGVVEPTEKGVPQGGVASPLLANAVLNKLDWFLHGKGAYDKAMRRAMEDGEPNLRFVRYADDWCVFITRATRQYAETFREQIREFLDRECGLRLSVEKTHVTHARDGFDFLGFRLELGTGRRGKVVPKITVPPKAMTQGRRRLDEAMRYRPQQESIAGRIQRGSAVVRGWSNHYCIAHNFSYAAGRLDHYAFWSAAKTICRKQGISTAKVLRKYWDGRAIGIDKSCRLAKFSDTKTRLKYPGPLPYEPGREQYAEDQDLEAGFYHREERRFGRADLKWATLQRDGYRCRQCGKPVTAPTSQADHIVPVRRFASFALASKSENVQTLCLDCHGLKHRVKPR